MKAARPKTKRKNVRIVWLHLHSFEEHLGARVGGGGGGITKGLEEIFAGHGYVQHLDCAMYVTMYQIVHVKYAEFTVGQVHLNQVLRKPKRDKGKDHKGPQ